MEAVFGRYKGQIPLNARRVPTPAQSAKNGNEKWDKLKVLHITKARIRWPLVRGRHKGLVI